MSESIATASKVGAVRPDTSFFIPVLQGAGALYVSTIVLFLGRLGFVVLVARMAGAEALGVYTIGFVSMQVLSMFALFGIDVALVHYASPAFRSSDKTALGNLFWASLLSALFLATMLSAGYWFFIPYYPLEGISSGEALVALQWFALALPFQVMLSVMGAFALAHGTYQVRVFAERIVPSLGQIIALLVLLQFVSVWNAVSLAFVASMMMGVCVAILFTFRFYPRGVAITDLWRQTRRLYAYGYMQGLARVVGYSLMNANLFLLGALSDSFQVGVYAAASRLTLIGVMFLEAFGQMFGPIAASQTDLVKFKQEFQWVTKWILMLSTPLFLLLAVFAPVWMGMMGPVFVASSSVLTILAVAQILNMMTGPSAVAQAMRGRPWLAFLNNILAWGTGAVLTALWAASYGALGAAVAYLFAILVMEILEMLECFVFFRFSPFGMTMLRPLFLMTVLGMTAWFLYNAFIWNIFTAILISGIMLLGYMLLIWRFGLEPQDLVALRSVASQLRVRL